MDSLETSIGASTPSTPSKTPTPEKVKTVKGEGSGEMGRVESMEHGKSEGQTDGRSKISSNIKGDIF